MNISANGVMVEFEAIGEGLSGDYNEDDPRDIELMRFTVLRSVGAEWEQVEDASYCTQIPVDTDAPTLARLLSYLFGEVYGPVSEGASVRRLCERLSWLSPFDLF